jgi:very-short-patch-repair endonuclease
MVIKNNVQTLQFLARIKYDKLPNPEQEYHVYIRGKVNDEQPRRIDFAWPGIRFAVEIEGGDIWHGKSRHTNGQGYINDMKKYNWLSKNGWTLLRYTWKGIDYAEIKEVYNQLSITLQKINEIKFHE